MIKEGVIMVLLVALLLSAVEMKWLKEDVDYWKQNSTERDEVAWKWFNRTQELQESIAQKCWLKLVHENATTTIAIKFANYTELTYIIENGSYVNTVRSRCEVLEDMCGHMANCKWESELASCRCVTTDMQFWNDTSEPKEPKEPPVELTGLASGGVKV